MRKAPPSPAIAALAWGRVDVDLAGQAQQYKDCRLWPGGAAAWDWGVTGTRHVPGIQIADIAPLLEHGVDVLVLTRGTKLVLQIAPDTLTWLADVGLEYHVEETRLAADRYNRLAGAGTRVAGLFHSTC